MKKLVLSLNPLHPFRDHNSNLILRITPYLDFETKIVSLNVNHLEIPLDKEEPTPTELNGIPIYFAKNHKLIDRLILALSKPLLPKHLHTTFLLAIKNYLKLSNQTKKRDIILATHELTYSSLSASFIRKKAIKALFLMDPPHPTWREGKDVSIESKHFLNMLKRYDVVFTTTFIHEAMERRGYSPYVNRFVDVSFPLITGFNKQSTRDNDEKIILTFSGRLYLDSKIRSPEYFLKIVSRLDSRFKVIFVGVDAPQLIEEFDIKTNAEIELLPQLEQDELQQLIADSDILINIGNAIPVHMPSKTLDYINTGKPIVNFYKLVECPTLYYTKSYPLCLNLNEKDNQKDIEAVTSEFVEFCVKSKGKVVDQNYILDHYSKCTPKEIGNTITKVLSQLHNEKTK